MSETEYLQPKKTRRFNRRSVVTTASIIAGEAAIGVVLSRTVFKPLSDGIAHALETPAYIPAKPANTKALDKILQSMHLYGTKELADIKDPAERLSVIGRQTGVDLYDPRILRGQLRRIRFAPDATRRGLALVNATAQRHFKFTFDTSDIKTLEWKHISDLLDIVTAFSFYPKALFEIIEFESKHRRYGPNRPQVFKLSSNIRNICQSKIAAGCESSVGPVAVAVNLDRDVNVHAAVHEWLGHRLMNSINGSDADWMAQFVPADIYVGASDTYDYLKHKQTRYTPDQYGAVDVDENYAEAMAADSTVESFNDYDKHEFGLTVADSSPRVVVQAALMDLLAKAVDTWQAQHHSKRSDALRFFELRHQNFPPHFDGAKARETRTMQFVDDVGSLAPVKNITIDLGEVEFYATVVSLGWLSTSEAVYMHTVDEPLGRVKVEQLNRANPSHGVKVLPPQTEMGGAISFATRQDAPTDYFRITDTKTGDEKIMQVSANPELHLSEVGLNQAREGLAR